jgi:hypothetical protein
VTDEERIRHLVHELLGEYFPGLTGTMGCSEGEHERECEALMALIYSERRVAAQRLVTQCRRFLDGLETGWAWLTAED